MNPAAPHFATRKEVWSRRTAGVTLKIEDGSGLMTAALCEQTQAMLAAFKGQIKMGSIGRAEHAVNLHP